MNLTDGEPGPHGDAADCPTYYDGCHCTVESLTHNIERAEKAEAERDQYRKLIEKLAACQYDDNEVYDLIHEAVVLLGIKEA